MALISCTESPDALQVLPVENEPWQKRAKAAGLTQKSLARLLGVAENTVSLQLRGKWQSGVPQYVKTVILAWERLSPEAKAIILESIEDAS